ncbi:lipoate--protein ligase [Desulfitobacterium sp.]|uniref:lipoate--protein ligase n=1 Tax=Desulfitobacterium sp. TaxID=49981 RepID=UPI002CDF3B2F|nr:lipoate--protein ligase [Desulfitobacterium sp.]HVJ47601.1 lipoate--protein ligase [Desulfitobacterium sp.]
MNQPVQTKIVLSDSFDPWHNLALEEFLFRNVEKNQVILYLWQNQNTVVIGRNQNAWKECRCAQLEGDGGKLARRLSGGGAVFHDLGNLNFTFIMDRSLYDLQKQLQVILEGTKKLGIDAEFTGRNDLTVDGKKFSGNAFYFEGDKAYHHGTIMIDVDVQKVSAYLQVSKEKMVSKGVDSVQSRVTNLHNYRPELTIDEMKETLKQSFQEIYGESPEPVLIKENDHDLKALYAKYSSWDWLYGKTPQFDVVFETRFPWGGIDLGLTLHKGIVTASKIYSDAMNANLIEKIAAALVDIPLKSEEISQGLNALEVAEEDKQVIEDIKSWLQSKIE